jgi:hypothetical protein
MKYSSEVIKNGKRNRNSRGAKMIDEYRIWLIAETIEEFETVSQFRKIIAKSTEEEVYHIKNIPVKNFIKYLKKIDIVYFFDDNSVGGFSEADIESSYPMVIFRKLESANTDIISKYNSKYFLEIFKIMKRFGHITSKEYIDITFMKNRPLIFEMFNKVIMIAPMVD